jgi:hypothetical protein
MNRLVSGVRARSRGLSIVPAWMLRGLALTVVLGGPRPVAAAGGAGPLILETKLGFTARKQPTGRAGEGIDSSVSYRQDSPYTLMQEPSRGEWILGPPDFARAMLPGQDPPKTVPSFPPELRQLQGGGTYVQSCDHKRVTARLENPRPSGNGGVLSVTRCKDEGVLFWYQLDYLKMDVVGGCWGPSSTVVVGTGSSLSEEARGRAAAACQGARSGKGIFVGFATWNELEKGKRFSQTYTGKEGSLSIDLTAGAKLGLEAVPGGPYSAVRGTKVRLDGSRSTGAPERSIWTLSGGEGCPGGVPTKRVEGAIVEVTVLCGLKAELRVEKGRSHDEATTQITVQPREGFKTDFPAANTEGVRASAEALHWGCVVGSCDFGRNVCALDRSDDTHDIVHNAGDQASYEGDAFVLGTVADPSSPFHGWSWVVENRSRIHRRSLLNPELRKNSRTESANRNAGGPFARDFAALAQSVHDHEQLHSEIYREQLARHGDPAVKMEKVIGPRRDSVRTQVNELFFDLSSFFSDEYSGNEEEVHARLARTWNRTVKVLLMKEGKFEAYDFGGRRLAELGD